MDGRQREERTLFLNADGTVKSQTRIGGLSGSVALGTGVQAIPDLDGDGVTDLVVGGQWLWVFTLTQTGQRKTARRVGPGLGGFEGELDPVDGDFFGRSVTVLGDLDGDGFDDWVAGAARDDDGGSNRGALWILFQGGKGPGGRPSAEPGGSGVPMDLPLEAGRWGRWMGLVRSILAGMGPWSEAARPPYFLLR